MSTSEHEFHWDGRKDRAAVLVAEDSLSHNGMAETLGIGRATLTRWKQHPAFQARVAEHRAEFEAAMLRFEIAKKRKRVARLDRDWRRMQQVIEARAADPDLAGIPGGDTGLVAAEPLLVKVYDAPSPAGAAGDDEPLSPTKVSQIVRTFSVDTGLLKELRAHEEQAAKELGQWVEKREDKHDATESFLDALRRFGRDPGDDDAG